MKEGTRTFAFVFILLCLCQPPPGIGANLICSLFEFTPEQKNLCVQNPHLVAAISRGVNIALKECEYQFQNQRWNCNSTKRNSLSGQTRAVPGTREAAFTSAIVAAGVAHAVTRECAKGNISSCSCDKSKQGEKSGGGWKWGGCSHDIEYGIGVSNKFLAPSGLTEKKFELQNKHNSHVGRKVIQNSFETDCRCHGACGSCASKTCWKSLSMFRKIGHVLHEKYKASIDVTVVPLNKRFGTFPIIVQSTARFMKPPEDELVHLRRSPSYCDANPKLGVVGTSGRKCDHLSKESNGCEPLCCGRGYNKMEYTEKVHCNCRFYYCCWVQCDQCKKKTQATICK